MGTNWAAIDKTISDYLSAGRSGEAAAYARNIVGSYLGKPGSEKPLTDLLRNLARSRDLHFIDLIGAVAENAAEGSALKEVAAGCLLSLSMAFNRAAAVRAAQTVWTAAEKLPPESPAGEAALDRLIDLAQRDIANDNMAATFLRLAAARAIPYSELAEKSRDLWLQKLETLDKKDRLREIKAAIIHTPGEALHGVAASLWRKSVQDMISRDKTEEAFTEVLAVITDPAVPLKLEREAAGLWVSVIDKWGSERTNRAILKASATSKKIYEKAPDPEQCAYIKETVAWKLLELARETGSENISHALIMKAADYDGRNISLRRRLVEQLSDIVLKTDSWERRAGAGEKLKTHTCYLNRYNVDRSRPTPPEFKP